MITLIQHVAAAGLAALAFRWAVSPGWVRRVLLVAVGLAAVIAAAR